MTSIEKMQNESLRGRGRGVAVTLLITFLGGVTHARAADAPQPVVPPKPVVLQPMAAMPPPPPAAPTAEPATSVKKPVAVKAAKSKAAKKPAKPAVKAKPKRR